MCVMRSNRRMILCVFVKTENIFLHFYILYGDRHSLMIFFILNYFHPRSRMIESDFYSPDNGSSMHKSEQDIQGHFSVVLSAVLLFSIFFQNRFWDKQDKLSLTKQELFFIFQTHLFFLFLWKSNKKLKNIRF